MAENLNLEEFLKDLKKKGIYFYYTEVYNEKGELEGYQIFVPYEDIDIIEDKYDSILGRMNIVLSPAVEGKILKKLLEDLKKSKNLKIGKEIENLEGNGFAVYINWTSKAFTVHKYENGSFKSKSCKKTLYWETENGIWVIGFASCEDVNNFIKVLKNFLNEHFGVDYSLNYHRACSAYETCKK